MKIYGTYVDTLYLQEEETHIAGFFINGGSEIDKNDKDRWTFFEKRGTMSSTKTSTPKNMGELSHQE